MNPHEKYQAALKEFRALSQKGAWTPEEEARAAELKTEMEALKADISRDNARLDARRAASEHHEFLNGAGGNAIEHEADPDNSGDKPEVRAVEKKTKLAVAEMRGAVKNLSSPEVAFRFGQFLRATIGNSSEARSFCKNAGIEVRVNRQEEGQNEVGGYLVPTQFDNEILGLREEAGVIRRLAKNKTMTSDTLVQKVREGGLKAFPIGEHRPIPTDKKKWGQVELKARKIGVIARYTAELSEDAIINIADDLAGEMGLAFSQFEDEAGFNGDGTAQYHGIFGFIPSLKLLSNDIAKNPSLFKATGNTWDSITRGDILGLMGCISSAAFKRKPIFLCSHQFYLGVFERLIEEAGGTSRIEMVNGKPTFSYKGYTVEIVPQMPSTDGGAGTVPLLFGDPSLAGVFGDRRGLTLARSTEATVEGESLWEQEEAAIRATERFDFKTYDLGVANADPKLRKLGAMAGLIL